MATFEFSGSVIDAATRRGIPALRIEAWGRSANASRELAYATTDTAGRFAIRFDMRVSQQNPDPIGYIKIISGTTVLRTLPDQPIRQWTPQATPLLVELDQSSDNTVQLFVSLLFSNNRLGAGVQLIFSYALPAGGTWTSQPFIADAAGKLSFEVPIGIGAAIDWSRAGYAFSKAGKPLQVAETSPPEQVSTGIALTIKLKSEIVIPGPQQDPDKWYVRGLVSTPYGDPVRANVSAAALSLQGEEPLGQVQTSDTGRYEIIYQWDGQCPPDIQVSASVADRLIAQSPIYFAAGQSVRSDLILDNETYIGPTEFQVIEERVLRCNDGFDISAIGKKQFDYLLGKTRLPEDKLSFYLVARKLSSLCDVPTAVFYGLFRAKLPATLQGLVLQPPKVLRNALDKSIRQSIIERKYGNAFDSLLAALRQMAVVGSLNNNQQLDHTGVGDLLTMAEVPATAQQQLISLYLEHAGDDASFWETVGKDSELAPYADKTKTTLQTGALTTYHLPTMQALKTQLGAEGTTTDLARWQDDDWQELGRSLQSVPDGIPGEALPQRIQFYVGNIRRTVKRAFAREYTTANVLRSANFADPVLHEFLNAVPDFDYGNASIPAVLNKTDITGEPRNALEKTLKGMQRLYRVAPLEDKFTVMDTLYASGLTSSRDIALQGSAQFVDLYADALGGAEIAAYVYDKASTVTAVSTNLLAGYSDLFNASDVYAIGGGVPISQPDAEGDLVIPSYQDLFGSQSFCECMHCTSVYSPAAYLADLLEFIRLSLVTRTIGGSVYVKIMKNGVEANKTGLDVLFARRPDLGDIRLDCKNTNTVLPYIDLVNEIYERAVVGATDSTLYQTNWTEQELKANPEHILSDAYDVLAETTYPLTLPFRLWNVEANHYLNHLGAPRWKLMQTMVDLPTGADDSFEQVNLAYLALVALDVEILKGAPAYSGSLEAVGKMWGFTSIGWRESLASVPEFLKRSGLSYDELLQLLQVPYVQADGQFGVDFSEAESVCDIDGAVLRYTAGDPLLSKETFDRIQRLLRLLRKTGWSIWELGRVLAALPLPQISVRTLVQVSVLKRLADSLALDVLEVISWWANPDTALDDTNPDYRSWYETIFLNSAVLNPPDQALLLDPADRSQLAVEAGAGALISDHFSSIAAALQISESEATLLAESLLDTTGAVDDALTLENLGQMFRIVSLSRVLGIDTSQYLLLTRLIDANPFDASQPQAAIEFVDAVQFLERSEFSSAELGYLLLHDETSVGTVQKSAVSVGDLLTSIQIAVRAVWARYALTSTPVIDQLKARLGDYFDQETIDSVVTMVGQTVPYSPEDRTYLQETLVFLAPAALGNAIAQNKPADARYKSLLILLNRNGRSAASINVVAQIVADAFSLDLTVAQQLLTEVVSRTGQPGEFVINALLDPLFIESGKEKLAAAIATEFQQEAFNIVEATSVLSDAEIEAFIALHFAFLDTEEATANLVGAGSLTDVLERYQYVTAALDEAQYTLTDAVFAEQFAAIHSVQKSALVVSKFEITETELPILNQHAAELQVLPLKGYPFVEQEQNFAGFEAWMNLANLLSLRRIFVATDSQLFVQLEKVLNPDLIDLVSVNDEVDALISSGVWQETQRPLLVWLYEFANATGWSFSEIVHVAGPELLAASLADFSNPATLVYLVEVMELAVRLGTTAAQLQAWSALDLMQGDAANAKQTARARYSLEQWYEVAPTLRDVLREKQRDALTAYMLHEGGFGSTVELYNHHLIDSEMSARMLTSRVKLALSSVQLFLQRCLLNLEDEFVAVTAAEEWEWRKNYRVWEANRKVFLFPENYIKPELRITRSGIFDAAQSILLQNEVTKDVADEALLRYLEELDDISNLQVAGSYHEVGFASDGETAIDRLHVVARSRGIPRKYHYRVRDGLAWSPWQEIDEDIGADQVMPVVVNSRLYLFWPVFFEKQIAGVDVLSNSAMQDAKDAHIEYDDYEDYLLHWVYVGVGGYTWSVSYDYSSLEAWGGTVEEAVADLMVLSEQSQGEKAQTWEQYLAQETKQFDGMFEETFGYFEIKLSVSEYKNGHWLPSRTSEYPIESDRKNSSIALLDENQIAATPGDFHFYTSIEDDIVTVECVQTLRFTDEPVREYVEGSFEYNVLSKEILAIEAVDALQSLRIQTPTGADVVDNAYVEDEERLLEIPLIGPSAWQPTYVTLLEKTPGTFRLPIQHQYDQFAARDAFFFGDDKRSFVVCPDNASRDAQYQVLGTDSPLLEGYLNSANPGIGVYDDLMQDFSGMASTGVNLGVARAGVERSGRAAKTLASVETLTAASQDPIAGVLDTAVDEFFPTMPEIYRFESFYHPLVGELIKKVNGEGTAAALSRDTQSTRETFFIAAYQPTVDVAEEYPLRDFSFSDLDANGFCNNELFFHMPLLIAVRLSKNQQFAAAQQWFHTIFDPTSRTGDNGAQRFWQFKPFFDMYDSTAGHPFDSIYDMLSALAADPATADSATLELKSRTEQQIAAWRAKPFDPHVIAALRPVAYMKTVVMEYLNNLIAWGDYLFEQFDAESINEAVLYYTLAYQILGDRPVALPELKVVAKSYNELGSLDAFSNAAAELENLINLPDVPPSNANLPPPLYFCTPGNPTLSAYRDTIEDRLFKIRHCMTIDGVVQQLPLFEPPIDPALLVLARASGVSISSALASLATPAPYYRFVYLVQKAVEYCQVVKGLGSQLLAAYDKKDAERLNLLHAEHAESLLKASTDLRNLQVDEARENLAAVERSKLLAQERLDYYSRVEKRSEKEKAANRSLDAAEVKRIKSADREKAASRASMFPDISVTGSATGVSVGTSFGGSNIGASLSADAAKAAGESAWNGYNANKLSTDASYDRRWDDWKLQQRLAKNEIKQIDKQIIAAKIRVALAEKERDNHAIQQEQSREVKEFLSGKFSNEELYGWMISQTSAIYFQSYKLAYDLAKRCEKAYQRECGEPSSTYIAYGYFDSMKKGLLSGERLHHDLQRMEFDYLNNNRRELEITKPISLFQLNPRALLDLRETGACEIHIPEVEFDKDFAGHYFRRIKAIKVTIPCIVGPYTSVSATLRLVQSWTRREVPTDQSLAPEPDTTVVPQTAIAISAGDGDSGMFEFNFRDERFLPFEGAGAISTWRLELPQSIKLLDYDTIADVVIHLSYTARDGGQSFKQAVNAQLIAALNDWKKLLIDTNGATLERLFSLRQDFSADWIRFLASDQPQKLTLHLSKQHFPRYLDYWWEDTNGDGKPDNKKPIKLGITAVKVYLDSQGLLADAASISINGKTSTIDASNGLPVFDLEFAGEITNESGLDLTLTVGAGELQSADWKDMYVLMNYEVEV